jgi:hypothetical protein
MTQTVAEFFYEGDRLDFIPPVSRLSAVAYTGWVSMRDFHKAVAIYNGGLLAANAVVDMQILQATDGLGAGSKIIADKHIATLGNADDNVACVIELDASELDVDNAFDWINLELSCGGAAACLTSAVLIRYQPRFKPVDSTNLAEIVD